MENRHAFARHHNNMPIIIMLVSLQVAISLHVLLTLKYIIIEINAIDTFIL